MSSDQIPEEADFGSHSRKWVMTINNPTFDDAQRLWDAGHNEDVRYLVYGAEHVDEGTPHFQCYIVFKGPYRFSRVKRMFPRAALYEPYKCDLANKRYCKKEGFYMEFGSTGEEARQQSRKRAEMEREEVIHQIRMKQMKFSDLTDEQLLDNKLVRAAEKAVSMISGPNRQENLQVVFIVGPTGLGKSYAIHQAFDDVTIVDYASGQEWFLNAEARVALFDEFNGQISERKMLKYLEPYPCSLPVKGGHRPCYWNLIFICSNTTPDQWYMKELPDGTFQSRIPSEVRAALYRRIGWDQPLSADGYTRQNARATSLHFTKYHDKALARQAILQTVQYAKEWLQQI